MSVMEIIISAVDKASDVVEKVGEKGAGAAKKLEDSWLKVTAAGVVTGGAIMKLTGRSHELNDGIRRTAVITGESEEELRNMIQTMTDATFSNDDAVASMERLIQSGVREKETFEKLLPVFDDFADATGKDMVQGIDIFDKMLSALDIPLENTAEHMDTLTYLTTQTTVDMGNLGALMRREAPALKDMELSVDDIAVAMASLEAEGRKGPRAVMGFQDALKDAEGDANKFWEALGVGNDTLEEQRKQLGESAGLTQELAEINNASLGIWDDIKHRVDNAMWSMGSFLEPVKDLGPLLIAIGPAIKGVSMAKGALSGAASGATAAIKGLTIAKGLMLLPILLLVATIGILVGAFIHLWKTNEDFRDKVLAIWEKIKAFGMQIWESLKEAISEIMEELQKTIESVLEWLLDFWDEWGSDILAMAEAVWNQIKLTIETAINVVKDVIGLILAIIRGDWEEAWNRVKSIASSVWNWLKGTAENIFGDLFRAIGRILDRIRNKFSDIWGSIRRTASSVWNSIGDGIRGSINRIIRALNGFIRGMNRMGFSVPNWVPVIGGRRWSLNIPRIPTLHTGGIFRAPSPGGEGLAILRDRERVVREGEAKREESRQNWESDNNSKEIAIIRLIHEFVSLPEEIDEELLTSMFEKTLNTSEFMEMLNNLIYKINKRKIRPQGGEI